MLTVFDLSRNILKFEVKLLFERWEFKGVLQKGSIHTLNTKAFDNFGQGEWHRV